MIANTLARRGLVACALAGGLIAGCSQSTGSRSNTQAIQYAGDAGSWVEDLEADAALPLEVEVDSALEVDGGGMDMAEAPLPPPNPHDGHHVVGSGDGYDIWTSNCHTAANRCVLDHSDGNVGILACGGDPQNSPAHHTANWQVYDNNLACIHNWGESCCWQTDGTSPPDITQGPGFVYDRTLGRYVRRVALCAQWACDDQYGADTRALPAGELVEIPGPAACVREAAGLDPNQLGSSNPDFDASNHNSCLSCCARRASLWDAQEWGQAEHDEFLSTCRTLCDGFFNDGVDGSDYGQQCVANVSYFSIHSYHEQCRTCCLDGAGVEYGRYDVNSCLGQCRSAYPE